MTGKRLTPEEIEAIKADFILGLSVNMVYRKVQCAERTVRDYFRKFRREGVERKKFDIPMHRRSKITEDELSALREACKNKEPQSSAARRLGLSRSCVKRWYYVFLCDEQDENNNASQKKPSMPRRHYVGNFDL